MQIANAQRGVFLHVVAAEEPLRTTEAVVNMQMSGDRSHGGNLGEEIEAAIGAFDIGVAEVDQRHHIGVVDGLDRLGHLRRGLAILARLGGKDVLERNMYAIGTSKFGQFGQRFAFPRIRAGTFVDLVGAQVAAMLHQHSGADAVAEFNQRLGSVELVTLRHRVHEVGRDQAMDSVAEIELAGAGKQTLHAFGNDATAGHDVDAGDAELDGVDAYLRQRPQIFVHALDFAISRRHVETGSDDIAHVWGSLVRH